MLRDLAWTVHRRGVHSPGTPSLPMTEITVLTQVREDPGLTVGAISTRLGVRQPNASTAVRTLVERGLARREPSRDDGRVTLIFPTAAAEAEHSALAERWAGPVRAALNRLPAAQRTAIEAATEALRALEHELVSDADANDAGTAG